MTAKYTLLNDINKRRDTLYMLVKDILTNSHLNYCNLIWSTPYSIKVSKNCIDPKSNIQTINIHMKPVPGPTPQKLLTETTLPNTCNQSSRSTNNGSTTTAFNFQPSPSLLDKDSHLRDDESYSTVSKQSMPNKSKQVFNKNPKGFSLKNSKSSRKVPSDDGIKVEVIMQPP